MDFNKSTNSIVLETREDVRLANAAWLSLPEQPNEDRPADASIMSYPFTRGGDLYNSLSPEDSVIVMKGFLRIFGHPDSPEL